MKKKSVENSTLGSRSISISSQGSIDFLQTSLEMSYFHHLRLPYFYLSWFILTHFRQATIVSHFSTNSTALHNISREI